jgi:hypothetical protein
MLDDRDEFVKASAFTLPEVNRLIDRIEFTIPTYDNDVKKRAAMMILAQLKLIRIQLTEVPQ